MRDLDQGFDYEVLAKKTKALRKHHLLSPDVGVKGSRGHSYCWCIVALLIIGWILYLGFLLFLKSKGFYMFGTTDTTATAHLDTSMNLVRIPAELANKNGAYCLDGTVPSYYFRKGKKKMLMFQSMLPRFASLFL